jgi:hypothetical protein
MDSKNEELRENLPQYHFYYYCGNLPQGDIASGDRASDHDLRSDRVWDAAVWSATGLGITIL